LATATSVSEAAYGITRGVLGIGRLHTPAWAVASLGAGWPAGRGVIVGFSSSRY
jgi:hypothetical protein